MTIKDLSSFLTPNLELPWRDHVFVVEPPTKEAGLVMTALNATVGLAQYAATHDACPTCGRSGAVELDERTQGLLRAAENKDLGELSLGSAYQEMIEAGVPGPDLEVFELYAMYYWVMGEETADAILDARKQLRSGSASAPKAPGRQRNGRRSE